MTRISVLSFPVPPSLSVAVAETERVVNEAGIWNEKLPPKTGRNETPSTVSVQPRDAVPGAPGSVTTAVRLIVPAGGLPALSIRTTGVELFTTIDVSADVAVTPSETDTWITSVPSAGIPAGLFRYS